jgi:hypothetical protein
VLLMCTHWLLLLLLLLLLLVCARSMARAGRAKRSICSLDHSVSQSCLLPSREWMGCVLCQQQTEREDLWLHLRHAAEVASLWETTGRQRSAWTGHGCS